jgi:hypothetical protein
MIEFEPPPPVSLRKQQVAMRRDKSMSMVEVMKGVQTQRKEEEEEEEEEEEVVVVVV